MKRTFRGGVHPPDNKHFTADKPIEVVPVPERLIIPLRQHIGAPCRPKVSVGDLVKRGQLIGEAEAFVAASVHASTSGVIMEIADYPHPVLGQCPSVVIESDGKDEWDSNLPLQRDWRTMDLEEMREIVREAGIVGMGGATFPTHVKLSPPEGKTVDSFILNGAECEPYLTADYRLMIEQPDKVVTGVQICMAILGVDNGYVAIEDNKPQAVTCMREATANTNIEVVVLPAKYPQGAEKNLIKAVLGREVPSGGLPADVGVIVQNVGTMAAVSEAVESGIPLTERVMTVTGRAIARPGNFLVRIGTQLRDVVKFCQGFSDAPDRVIVGGPMMGLAQVNLEVPVIKGTSGLLCLIADDVDRRPERDCIRCGRCVEACPMGLVPSALSIMGERGAYEKARSEYNLLDCVECGSCVYRCPAKRNIVHYIKLAKLLSTPKR
ncbi:MAG: electron transport complex subunit RsxC [Negativicutes bacterium]|nr:electron transport complex subunit RsxC [Negativicutes bacterium]